jgi:hypothetical protein
MTTGKFMLTLFVVLNFKTDIDFDMALAQLTEELFSRAWSNFHRPVKQIDYTPFLEFLEVWISGP